MAFQGSASAAPRPSLNLSALCVFFFPSLKLFACFSPALPDFIPARGKWFVRKGAEIKRPRPTLASYSQSALFFQFYIALYCLSLSNKTSAHTSAIYEGAKKKK